MHSDCCKFPDVDWNPLAFMEFFVVLAFVAGWLVIERVCRHFDRQREKRIQAGRSPDERPTDSRQDG